MDSREVLAEARRAAGRAKVIQATMNELGAQRRSGNATPTTGNGWVSDSTAAIALNEIERSADLAAELESCKVAIQDGVQVLRAVAAAFGGGYAEALRLRYVLGMTWGGVGERLGCSWMTAKRHCLIALDWADSASPATIRAARGGFAEA